MAEQHEPEAKVEQLTTTRRVYSGFRSATFEAFIARLDAQDASWEVVQVGFDTKAAEYFCVLQGFQ